MNITGDFSEEAPGEELIQLDQRFFPQPWTPEQWRTLDLQRHRLFTLRKDGDLIGFALFSAPPFDDTAHLYKILIDPDFRGKGHSHDFWTKIKTELTRLGFKSVYLEVETENTGAVRFYRKEGFQLLREVKGFYAQGESAYIMQLTL